VGSNPISSTKIINETAVTLLDRTSPQQARRAENLGFQSSSTHRRTAIEKQKSCVGNEIRMGAAPGLCTDNSSPANDADLAP
jgi:hypothetical protein